jgi:hypothetical protein
LNSISVKIPLQSEPHLESKAMPLIRFLLLVTLVAISTRSVMSDQGLDPGILLEDIGDATVDTNRTDPPTEPSRPIRSVRNLQIEPLSVTHISINSDGTINRSDSSTSTTPSWLGERRPSDNRSISPLAPRTNRTPPERPKFGETRTESLSNNQAVPSQADISAMVITLITLFLIFMICLAWRKTESSGETSNQSSENPTPN